MSEHLSEDGKLHDTRRDYRAQHEPRAPSSFRVATWIIVAAVGLYLLGSGVIGILST